MPSGIAVHTEEKAYLFNKAVVFLTKWLHLYHNITQKTLLLLSGGSAVNLYKDLAKFLNTSDLDFSFLAIAQVDERYRPEGSKKDQRSRPKADQPLAENIKNNINAEIIGETGLWKVCKERGIPYYIIPQEGTLEKAAGQYNKIIEKLWKECVYKIAILGIGEDGHTAGLLPGYKKAWDKKAYAVGYENKGQFWHRITLTPKALIELDQAIVVATGEKKKEAIKNVIDERNTKMYNELPGVLIQKIPTVDLYTDLNLV